MKEIGVLNRELATILSEQGHGDMLMVVDAGFAIPKGIEVLDLCLKKNVPTVIEVLEIISEYFSVEKMIISQETKQHNPTFFNKTSKVFRTEFPAQIISHLDLKKTSKEVKAIIRTGDFTAYANVILISGAGDRWYMESPNKNKKR